MENPRAARAAAKLKSVAGGAGPNLEAADATYFFRFVPRVVRRPSVQFAGRERLTERGTYPRDLAAMIGSVNELAGGPLLRGGSALRQSGEGDEAFLARIHGRFVRSLSLKMPVVIAWNRLDFPAAAYDDLQQDLIPDDTRPPGAPRAGVGQFGHAVTATAVSPIFRRADGRPYFTLQHFDQQQSRWLEHHLFVEHANHRVYQTREADEFPPADQRVAMIGAEGRAVTPVLTMSTHLDGSFRLGDRHRYQLLEQMYASDKL